MKWRNFAPSGRPKRLRCRIILLFVPGSKLKAPPTRRKNPRGYMRFADIISEASKLARPISPSEECSAASVASVIISGLGNTYTGVCVDFDCGIGFCAEHAAVAEMLKRRESKISMVVAVNDRGEVLPPCGRCREMMWQLDPSNREALVVLGGDWALPLRELLPYR